MIKFEVTMGFGTCAVGSGIIKFADGEERSIPYVSFDQLYHAQKIGDIVKNENVSGVIRVYIDNRKSLELLKQSVEKTEIWFEENKHD